MYLHNLWDGERDCYIHVHPSLYILSFYTLHVVNTYYILYKSQPQDINGEEKETKN